MKKHSLLNILIHRTAALGKDESGAVLLLTLGIFLFLFVMVGGVYVIGTHIESRIKIQNAVDASAYSAAAVQADALSRMAVVNKAMSWTYVQLSKRQMDYITYRWLKLTLRNFDEDCRNAKNFHAWYPWKFKIAGIIPFYFKPEWLDFALRGPMECDDNHGKTHNGGGWYCGLSKDSPNMIILNGAQISAFKHPSDPEQDSELRKAIRKFEKEVLYPLEDLAGISVTPTLPVNNQIGVAVPPSSPSANSGGVSPYSGSYTKDELQNTNLSDLIKGTDMEYYYQRAKAESDPSTYLGKEPKKEDYTDPNGILDDTRYELAVQQYNRKKQFFSHAGMMDEPDEDDYNTTAEYEEAKAVYAVGMTALEEYARTRHGYQSASASQQKFENATGKRAPTKPGSNASDDEWNQYSNSLYSYLDDYNTWLNGGTVSGGSTGGSTGGSAGGSTGGSAGGSGGSILASDWGRGLGKMIEMDKNSIEMMNQMLAVINENMIVAMKDTVEMTLALNLAPQPQDRNNSNYANSGVDAKETVKKILADYQYFYQAPMSTNPYDTEAENNGYFSPLYNTEPHEQLFLAMGNTRSDHTLRSFFVDTLQGESVQAGGLDQWFIRGGAHSDNSETFRISPDNPDNPDDDNQYTGGEGMPGIMRVYKSANLNETNAGLLGGMVNKVDRGNHIITTEGLIPRFNFSFSIFYGLLDVGKIFSDMLNTVLAGVMPENFFDVAPSTGNTKSSIPYMCREVEDTIALYSEYRWSSAKWFCKWDIKWKPKWKLPKVRWREHVGLPKLFCGENHSLASIADFNLSDSVMEILEKFMQFFPPYFSPAGVVLPEADDLPEGYYGRNHGYMEGACTWLNLPEAFPYKQLFNDHSCSREDYRPCAMMLDNFQMPFIQGHARIYGDDREIFNENYIGANCRPWVINEKFFTGSGTVVVGAAKKLNNPFAAIFNVDAIADGLFQVFNPNNASDSSDASRPAWAIAAARAAVKDPNAGSRGYKLHFEDMYSKEANLKKHNDVNFSLDIGDIPAGCICHRENQDKITKNWNLCETDWEPVLIPLRYRGNKANVTDSGKPGEKSQYNNNTGFIDSDNFFNKSMWVQFDSNSANQNWSPDFNAFSPDGKSGSLQLDTLFDNNKIY